MSNRDFVAGILVGGMFAAGMAGGIGYRLGADDARLDLAQAEPPCPTVERVARVVVELQGCMNLLDSNTTGRAQGPWVYRAQLASAPKRPAVVALEAP